MKSPPLGTILFLVAAAALARRAVAQERVQAPAPQGAGQAVVARAGGIAVSLGGRTIDRVALVGTEFVAALPTGTLRGLDFVGAEFQAGLSGGGKIGLRVDRIDPSPNPGETDVYLYTVSFLAGEERRPFCGLDGRGEPIRAIPLAGTWDAGSGTATGGAKRDDGRSFTFACEGFVLAKCVHAGYRPWARRQCPPGAGDCDPVSLEPHHRACVRMFRADYCGDGVSHTVDGTVINLYDAIGIQPTGADWPFEAEWTPDGARCMARKRISEKPDPPCMARLLRPDCGDRAHFGTGTLLMNEVRPRAASPQGP
jgi:hypothetical protein